MRSNLDLSGLTFSPEEIYHECEKSTPKGSPDTMSNGYPIPQLTYLGRQWFVVDLKNPRGYQHSYMVSGVSEESVRAQHKKSHPSWEILKISPMEPNSKNFQIPS